MPDVIYWVYIRDIVKMSDVTPSVLIRLILSQAVAGTLTSQQPELVIKYRTHGGFGLIESIVPPILIYYVDHTYLMCRRTYLILINANSLLYFTCSCWIV